MPRDYLEFELDGDSEALLRAAAAAHGLTPEQLVARIIQEKLDEVQRRVVRPSRPPLRLVGE